LRGGAEREQHKDAQRAQAAQGKHFAIHGSTLGDSPTHSITAGADTLSLSCYYGATTKESVDVNCGPLAIGRFRRVKDLLWAWSTAQHPIIATRTNRKRRLAEESTEIST
jgi:hypothetical protein